MKDNRTADLIASVTDFTGKIAGPLSQAKETVDSWTNGTYFSKYDHLGVKQSTQAWEFLGAEPKEDFEPVEWFSNSSYFLYVDKFLEGFDLNNTFNHSGYCIGKALDLVDDVVIFGNNFTETFGFTPIPEVRPLLPFINLTQAVNDDLAYIPLYCWEFGIEMAAEWETIYAASNNDPSEFIQAFLFSLMAHSKSFKDSIDVIGANNEVQNYIFNFYEYGQIAHNVILEITPFNSPLDDSPDGFSRNELTGYDTYTQAVNQIIKRVPG